MDCMVGGVIGGELMVELSVGWWWPRMQTGDHVVGVLGDGGVVVGDGVGV